MLELNNQYTLMKRQVHAEVLKEFFAGTLKENVDKLPIRIIPKQRVPNRCCIYKERAMVRYRIMALLGINIESDDDELKSLAEYVEEVMETDKSAAPILTTISTACSSCPPDRYLISDACRGCGRCAMSCPFGAIVERSSLMPVVKMLGKEEHVTALIAPAIEGQFPGTLSQIKAALLAAGFSSVLEVSEGAETTSLHEAEELAERKARGEGYMTTSCCPAYMELVDKHLPFLGERRSSALSPMGYAALKAKELNPATKNVFIGPCLAKKVEALRLKTVDAVITFSELASLFIAKGIDVRELEGSDLGDTSSFEDCRQFALSGGVASCVLSRFAPSHEVQVLPVNGVDKKMFRTMKIWEKRPAEADLVEVMCCEGGCINGPGVVVKPSVAMKLRGGNKAAAPVKAMRSVIQ